MTHSASEGKQPTAAKCGIKQERIAFKLMDLIEMHYTEGLKVEAYAKKLFISVSNLERCCKAVSQKTVNELINERIVKEAKDLLINTDKHVREVAWELGWDYETNFNTFFSRKTGETPAQYRFNALQTN